MAGVSGSAEEQEDEAASWVVKSVRKREKVGDGRGRESAWFEKKAVV